MRSEFHPTTPAKPKTLPGGMANEISTLPSRPAKGPLIATFAIGALQHPRATSGEPHNRAAGWRKFVQRREVTPGTRRTSGTVEFGAKPQLSDIKPKVRKLHVQAAFSSRSAPFGPVFRQTCTLYWGCRFAGYGNK